MSKPTIKRSLKEKLLCPVRGGWAANICIINEYADVVEEPSKLNPCSDSETSSGFRLLDRINQEETTSYKSLSTKYLVTQQSNIDKQYNTNHLDTCPPYIPLALSTHMLKFFDSATVNRLYYNMINGSRPIQG